MKIIYKVSVKNHISLVNVPLFPLKLQNLFSSWVYGRLSDQFLSHNFWFHKVKNIIAQIFNMQFVVLFSEFGKDVFTDVFDHFNLFSDVNVFADILINNFTFLSLNIHVQVWSSHYIRERYLSFVSLISIIVDELQKERKIKIAVNLFSLLSTYILLLWRMKRKFHSDIMAAQFIRYKGTIDKEEVHIRLRLISAPICVTKKCTKENLLNFHQKNYHQNWPKTAYISAILIINKFLSEPTIMVQYSFRCCCCCFTIKLEQRLDPLFPFT